mmetsp:Transcript_39460/g.55568  ORF Transcript_39460/g.55568 Transcript_39460/m.55568 type:complete len:279 (-) Transcript_39460:1573-2409(-)
MTFGEGTLGELYQEEWPLPPGSYKMVIGRDGRRPYDLYSISNAFEVIENGRVCFSRGKHRMLRKSAGDLVHRSSTTNTITNASSNEFKLEIDPINWRAPDMTEEEWVDFIQGISNQDHDRHLLESSHIPFHNYQFLIDVRTEYYFRYGGTQTVPPCHAPLIKGEQHANTNHWRVMKDPIRVSTRQIIELERLLRERIAPRQTNGAASCMPDTAGKISGDGHHISVARPLMKTSSAHRMVFCDCGDWKSKWPEDQAWCQMREQKQRYFEHPYNFDTDSF